MPRCLCGTSVLRARSGLRKLVAFAQFWCILNPLESALTRPPASVHSTGLAEKLSPLESALTKNRGGGCASTKQLNRAAPRAALSPHGAAGARWLRGTRRRPSDFLEGRSEERRVGKEC